MKVHTTDHTIQFLTGGGEMGELTRNKDWSSTPVGRPESWPQSLRTSLSIILHSKFPMFLFWGAELTCFYNDAYRPSLGENGKHPFILGQPGHEAWPEIWDIIKPLIDQVLAGGEASWSEDQLIPIFRNGKIEDVYWTFSYSPVTDESGQPAGVFVTCSETTEKVRMIQAAKMRENQLNFTIDAAELGTWDLDPITNRFVGNDRLKSWFGLSPEEEIPLTLALDSIAEQDRPRVAAAIQSTLQPGSDGNYEIEYTIRNPLNQVERRVLAKGKALFDENQAAYRFSGTLQDVTAQILAWKKIEESEKRFRSIIWQAPIGITIFRGPEFVVEMANHTYLQLVDRAESRFIGRPLMESLPEVKESVGPLLTEVFKTGVSFYGTEFPVVLNRYGKKELTYFNFVYHALREDDGEISGLIVVAMEVTASVRAKHALVESEKQFRNLVLQSPVPMAILRGKDHIIEIANTAMSEKIWRKKTHETIGKKLLDVFPELLNQKYPELLQQTLTTGIPHRGQESLTYMGSNDERKKFYLDFDYSPLLEIDQSVSGIVVTINDVTEKVEARKKVEEAEERLRLATEATEMATWDLDIQTREVIHSPRMAEIFGHHRSKRITQQEMRDQLHPDDRREIVEKAFEVALQTGIYKYIARMIKPNGEICWVRTQGKVVYDEANKPLKMIGTLRDVTEEKIHQQVLQESEQKFRLLADSMERQVKERTGQLVQKNKELEKMNTELESFAYVSSHDLQEPLRKIQTFAARLLDKEEHNLSEVGKDYFRRMSEAANRMQTLIQDLLDYSRTNTTERNFKKTPLQEIVDEVKLEFKETIAEKHAVIETGKMCAADVIPFQFRQLLHNLIGNALKFSVPGQSPVIKINSMILPGSQLPVAGLSPEVHYCHLSIADNGIGFDPQYRERIFEVFQRLHGKSEYKGTGIGLAIVKKIVENHNGVITASSEVGKGATFDIYIPVE